MRILLIVPTITVGGAETFVMRLARKLRRLGHEASVLNLNPMFEDPALLGQFPDVPILRPPLPALLWIKRADRVLGMLGSTASIQRRLTVRWLLREIVDRFDVLHSHLIDSDRVAVEVKDACPRLRVVSTLHGDYAIHAVGRSSVAERSRIAGWKVVLSGLLAGVDRWVFISEEQRRLFAEDFGAPARRMIRIYNGYEPPVEPGAAEAPADRPFTFIMVGRALPEKGWRPLLEAFASLEREGARLVLVGAGPHLDQLRGEFGDNLNIEFAGFDSNPVARIGEADAFVFPSTYAAESLPTVIVEALWAGKPVIASDVGEIGQMLRTPDGESAGLLLPVRDDNISVERLREAMRSLIDHEQLRARLAGNTSGAFAKFDMDGCAKAYLDLYQSVCEPVSSSSSANH